jgi:hypothetical protein
LAIPARNRQRRPVRRRVITPVLQGGQPLAHQPGTTQWSWRARRRWSAQMRIQSQPGHEGGHRTNGSQELKRCISSVPHDHQLSLREPAVDQAHELSRPGGDRLVPSAALHSRAPRCTAERSEGASAVRKGSAHTRPAQGMGTSTIRQTQRSPLTLTKWLWLERTGSR